MLFDEGAPDGLAADVDEEQAHLPALMPSDLALKKSAVVSFEEKQAIWHIDEMSRVDPCAVERDVADDAGFRRAPPLQMSSPSMLTS